MDPRAASFSPCGPGLLFGGRNSSGGAETAALAASSSLYASAGQQLAFTESAAVAAELVRQISGYDEYDGSLESKLRGVGAWAGGCTRTQATDTRSYEENRNAFYLGTSFPKVIPLPPVLRRILNSPKKRTTAGSHEGGESASSPSPSGVLPLLHVLWAAEGKTLHLWPLPSPESPFFASLHGGDDTLSALPTGGGEGSYRVSRSHQRTNRSIVLQQQLLSTTSTHELPSPIRLVQHVILPRSLLPPSFSSSFSFFEPRRMGPHHPRGPGISSRLSTGSSLPRATSVFRCTYTEDNSLLLSSSSHGHSFSTLSSTHFHAFVVVTDASILILALVNEPFPEAERGGESTRGASAFSLQLYQVCELRLDQQPSSFFSFSPFSPSQSLSPRQITAIAAHQGASRVFLGDKEGRLYELVFLSSSSATDGAPGTSGCPSSSGFMRRESSVSLSVKKIRRRISTSPRQTTTRPTGSSSSSFSSSRFASEGRGGERMDIDGFDRGEEEGEVASIYQNVDDLGEPGEPREEQNDGLEREDDEDHNDSSPNTTGLLQCQLQPLGTRLFSRVMRSATKALSSVVLFSRKKHRRQLERKRASQQANSQEDSSATGERNKDDEEEKKKKECEDNDQEQKRDEDAMVTSMITDEERGLIWVINAASDVTLLVLEPPLLSADGTLVQRTNLKVSLSTSL